MFRARALQFACLLCHLVKHRRCDDNNGPAVPAEHDTLLDISNTIYWLEIIEIRPTIT